MIVQNNNKRHNLIKKTRRSSSSEDSYRSSNESNDIDIGAEVKLPKLPRLLEVSMFDANNLKL